MYFQKTSPFFTNAIFTRKINSPIGWLWCRRLSSGPFCWWLLSMSAATPSSWTKFVNTCVRTFLTHDLWQCACICCFNLTSTAPIPPATRPRFQFGYFILTFRVRWWLSQRWWRSELLPATTRTNQIIVRETYVKTTARLCVFFLICWQTILGTRRTFSCICHRAAGPTPVFCLIDRSMNDWSFLCACSQGDSVRTKLKIIFFFHRLFNALLKSS